MKTNILIAVDDTPDNLYVLKSLINEHLPDCELRTAVSAEEGLAMVRECDPDGLLIDVQMPGMGGVEMCRRLKEDERTAHVPVILITAHHADPKLKAKGLAAGADDFLSKPIDNIEFVARIMVMLRVKHVQDELHDINTHLDQLIDEKTKALQETEQKLRTLIPTAPVAISVTTLEGQVVSANRPAIEMLGHESLESFLQVPAVAHYYNHDDRGRFIAALKGGSVRDFEIQLKRKDGSMVWCSISSVAQEDQDGRVQFINAFQDITERKRSEEALRESEERFRSLFENSPLGYQSLDADGNFIEINGTWCRLLGYTKEEVIGENFSNFIHPDFREHFKENFPKFKNLGYVLGVEFEMIKKDGSEIIVSFDGKIGTAGDGTFKQTHCVLQDITERKTADEALQNLNTELEERVRDRTKDLRNLVNLMAGRENRMAELKQTIKKLRTQLEESGMTPAADDPLFEEKM